jgi:hypothetical protein
MKNNVELEIQKQVMESQIFEYTSARLTFRRSIIETMNDYDILIINVSRAQNPNNNGKFKMTKNQIYQTFDNVINSKSYRRDGNYNYEKTPQKAQQYRIN